MDLRHRASGDRPELLKVAVLYPIKLCQPRAPRFIVKLNLSVLAAVHAQHTMLTRMVLFHCRTCTERFPVFHPAFAPPEDLGMHLLKANPKTGCAPCNLRVGRWDDLPPLKESASELLLAKTYEGECLRCVVDMEHLVAKLGADARAEDLLPKFGFLNGMDPVYTFPGNDRQLQYLFDSATVVEAMLVALDPMQVTYVTAKSSGLQKFKKNVISFPQDIASFAKRVGLLCGFKFGDKVNSTKGPGRERDRAHVYAYAATEADCKRFSKDEYGRLFFSGTVREVLSDGALVVDNDCGGEGLEDIQDLRPRIRMPWHPRFLSRQFGSMVRRNLGHGQVLGGLEVRWGLVANILKALCAVGRAPWRGEEELGPMHKYYDRGLFDVLDEAELRETHAPGGRDCTRAADFEEAGFDVSYVGGRDVNEGGTEAEDLVSENAFHVWLESLELPLGHVVAEWWVMLPSQAGGDGSSAKTLEQKTAYDLFRAIRGDVEAVAAKALVDWLVSKGAFDGVLDGMVAEGLGRVAARQVLLEDVEEELAITGAHFRTMESSAPVELEGNYVDEGKEAEQTLENMVYGWPSRQGDPTGMREPGRFEKAFPLEFPMGVGGPFDDRPRAVPLGEHVQHLLRIRDGRIVNDLRGHRVVQALVNTDLVVNASGKTYAAHRTVQRRLRGRIVGGEVLTRNSLRDLLAVKHQKEMIVGQLIDMGKDVRSTPAHWRYHQKVLDCALKTLSWRPPWVRSETLGVADPMLSLLGQNAQVKDNIGLGRIPATWFTPEPEVQRALRRAPLQFLGPRRGRRRQFAGRREVPPLRLRQGQSRSRGPDAGGADGADDARRHAEARAARRAESVHGDVSLRGGRRRQSPLSWLRRRRWQFSPAAGQGGCGRGRAESRTGGRAKTRMCGLAEICAGRWRRGSGFEIWQRGRVGDFVSAFRSGWPRGFRALHSEEARARGAGLRPPIAGHAASQERARAASIGHGAQVL